MEDIEEPVVTEVIIEGSLVKTHRDFHAQFAQYFYFKDFYGKNLDALWDALTGMTDRPLTLIWKDSEISRNNMGDFNFYRILKVLDDTAKWDEEVIGKKYGKENVFRYILK